MYGILLIALKNDLGKDLVDSGFAGVFNKVSQTPAPSPTIAPPNAPKTFKFDSKTDLKAELEKVNPEVLDSDFE